MSLAHVWFICDKCERFISGCLQSCPEYHRVERVHSCAICSHCGEGSRSASPKSVAPSTSKRYGRNGSRRASASTEITPTTTLTTSDVKCAD